jgi:hypothetical protein
MAVGVTIIFLFWYKQYTVSFAINDPNNNIEKTL